MIIGISGKIGSGKDLIGNIIRTLIWLENPENKLRIPIEEFVQTNGIFVPEGMRGFINAYKDSGWELRKFADKLKDTVCLLLNCTRTELEDRDFKETELGEEWYYYKFKDLNNSKLISIDEYNSLHPNQKEWLELIKLTPRKILQLLGTEAGREIIHPNIWVNALFSDYKPNINPRNQLHHKENWFKKKGYNFEELKVRDRDLYFSLKEKYFMELNNLLPNWIITDVRFPNEANAILDRGGLMIRTNRMNSTPQDGHVFVNKQQRLHPSETSLDDYTKFDYVIENEGTITDLIEKVKEILIKENLL